MLRLIEKVIKTALILAIITIIISVSACLDTNTELENNVDRKSVV